MRETVRLSLTVPARTINALVDILLVRGDEEEAVRCEGELNDQRTGQQQEKPEQEQLNGVRCTSLVDTLLGDNGAERLLPWGEVDASGVGSFQDFDILDEMSLFQLLRNSIAEGGLNLGPRTRMRLLLSLETLDRDRQRC